VLDCSDVLALGLGFLIQWSNGGGWWKEKGGPNKWKRTYGGGPRAVFTQYDGTRLMTPTRVWYTPNAWTPVVVARPLKLIALIIVLLDAMKELVTHQI
jgi:hypothetical protein